MGLMQLALTLKQADGPATEFQLLPLGRIELDGDSPVMLDAAGIAAIIEAFSRRGNDMVIDYEHQTMQDVQAPAAGWIKNLIDRGAEGLWATVEWTKRAAEYLKNREYRYFSPVFWFEEGSRRIFKIENVALTNFPKINNLTPIMAKMTLEEAKKSTVVQKEEESKMLEKLKKLFGLAEDAGEDKVLETATAIVAKKADLEKQVSEKPKEVVAKEVLEALDLKETDGVSTVVASIHALKQADKGTVSREEFEKIQKDLRTRDADEIVTKALAEGKITPDQKEWAAAYAERDLEGFKVFAAKAPVVIPIDKLPKKETRAGDAIADEAVLAVAKMFGNTAEDIKTYGGMN
jgi:phage I-like protein